MINIINSFWGSSGYSSHGRSLANALNKLTEVKISTNLQPGWETQCNDAELEMIKREEDYETNLIITHPLNWKAHLNAKHHIAYLVWEGDKIPKWMVQECMNDKIEKIIVPSQHTKLAVVNTLHDKCPKCEEWWLDLDGEGCHNCLFKPEIYDKIVTISHGVDLKTFYPIETKKDDTFRFLFNKGLRNMEDRGGGMYLIKAYLEEFTESDKVELVLKINSAYGIPNLLEMFPNLKKKGIPKVRFITENYTTKQLNSLYNEADIFVSPTRAEAFNLPGLEAHATGLCTIQTNFGGQLTYMKDDIDFKINYKLVDAPEIDYEGVKWSIPDHTHLKSLLRYAFEHQDEIRERGQKAIQNAKGYTWDATAKYINELIY